VEGVKTERPEVLLKTTRSAGLWVATNSRTYSQENGTA
jgi:hypothetical protein